jgi:hypothetical protein
MQGVLANQVSSASPEFTSRIARLDHHPASQFYYSDALASRPWKIIHRVQYDSILGALHCHLCSAFTALRTFDNGPVLRLESKTHPKLE